MFRLFIVALLFSFLSNAWSQAYPSKPVKLIVTYPPGGSSDLMARVFGQKLSEVWSQQVLVESKPGAAGSIGMDYAARQRIAPLHRDAEEPDQGEHGRDPLQGRRAVKVMQDSVVKNKFADLGVEAVHSTPAQFVAFIKTETEKYSKLIKEAGIKGN